MGLPLLRTLRVCDLSGNSSALWSPVLFGDAMMWSSAVFEGCAEASGFASVQSTVMPRVMPWQARQGLNATNTILERVFYGLILENCVQVNLQSTFYALNIAYSKHPRSAEQVQLALTTSVISTVVSSSIKIIELKNFRSMVAQFDEHSEADEQNKSKIHYKSKQVAFGV